MTRIERIIGNNRSSCRLLDPNFIPRYIRHRIAEVATQEDILIKLSQDPAARVRSRPRKRLEILMKNIAT